MELGVVGLPNVGKTTLFNALTMANAEVANYPFCTIDRNVGMSEVPDERLWKLSDLLSPPKTTPPRLHPPQSSDTGIGSAVSGETPM